MVNKVVYLVYWLLRNITIDFTSTGPSSNTMAARGHPVFFREEGGGKEPIWGTCFQALVAKCLVAIEHTCMVL